MNSTSPSVPSKGMEAMQPSSRMASSAEGTETITDKNSDKMSKVNAHNDFTACMVPFLPRLDQEEIQYLKEVFAGSEDDDMSPKGN